MLRTLARSHAKASLPLSQTCQVLKTWQVFYRWNFKDLRGFQNLGGLILRLIPECFPIVRSFDFKKSIVNTFHRIIQTINSCIHCFNRETRF